MFLRIAVAAVALILATAGMTPAQLTEPAPTYYDGRPIANEPEISTPEPLRSIDGVATWYDATKNNAWYTRVTKWGPIIHYYAAAGPAARALIGDDNPYHEHYEVDVTNRLNGRRIRVTIVDWCSCSSGRDWEKAIDLSPAAFKALGLPLSRGIAPVTITLLP
jgi:hypothetical protein